MTPSTIFGYDPADYAVTGKALQWSLVGDLWVGDADPAAISLSVYSAATINASGQITLAAPILSILLHAAGAAAGNARARSAAINAPAAGSYLMAIDIATAATTAIATVEGRLELSYV